MNEFHFQRATNGGWTVYVGHKNAMPQAVYAYTSTEDLMAALPKLLDKPDQQGTMFGKPSPGDVTFIS